MAILTRPVVMGLRGSRRLLSTLSSSPTPFPPPEALSSATSVKPFQPRIWASLQPPPASTLHAFASRIRLFAPPAASRAAANPPADMTEILTQALTHPSFLNLHSEHAPASVPQPRTNAEWEVIGNHLMGLFAAEFVHATYPHLPTSIMKAAVTMYVGPQTCMDVTREWGLTSMVRWTPVARTDEHKPVDQIAAWGSVSRSVVALTYLHQGIGAARDLVHKYFLSREVDLRPLIKFRNPMKALQETVKSFGRERPLARLLKETGRFSISPVFVVGVYSGDDKLGEGFGSALRMAEFRASEDALRRLYLTQTPPSQLSLPTSTFSSTRSVVDDPFTALLSTSESSTPAYVPGELGQCEVLYGSSDPKKDFTALKTATTSRSR